MSKVFNGDVALGRSLPGNLDAERSLLGAILLDNALCNQAVELLKRGDFLAPSHRRIFDQMVQLSAAGHPIDLITLSEELERSGDLDTIGGASYLASLIDGVPRTSNLERYAQIIKGKSVFRQLIQVSEQIANAAFEQDQEPGLVLDYAEKLIFDIAEDRIREGFSSVKDIAHERLHALEEMAGREHLMTGLATGYPDLDELTSGLQPSELIVVAARPSVGKTAFCLNVAERAALNRGASVGIFSLEMSKQALVQRMLCSEARVDQARFRSGRVSKAEWAQLFEALARLSKAKIFIDDTPGIGVMEMRAKARRLKAEHGLDLLIVDYMQLMSGRGRPENRQQEVSQISRELKGLAKELDIPLVALSQLSRAPEKRGDDHRPQLADLRESGSIEQDADLVLFLFREFLYHPTEENRGEADLIIGKQRNGPLGTVRLVFLEQFTRFETRLD